MTILFGYRHVTGVPTCPCKDPGNYLMCEQDDTNPLGFLLRCWCSRTIRGTWDNETEKTQFLTSHNALPAAPTKDPDA